MSWADGPRLVPPTGQAAVAPRRCPCLCHAIPGIGHLAGPCVCELDAIPVCLDINCDGLRCASGRCEPSQAGQLLERDPVSVDGSGSVVT